MMVRKTSIRMLILVGALSWLAPGCLSVKTEHEIKPIQITLDVNLKVQKELEDFLNLD